MAVGTAPIGRLPPVEELLALLASGGDWNVAQLMVRNVDEAVVRELKKRAPCRTRNAMSCCCRALGGGVETCLRLPDLATT